MFRFYRIVGYIFILLLIATSCEVDEGLVGSGDVTTKRRVVQDFEILKIDGVLNVYFSPAEIPKVEVKTDDNLQYIVEVKNDGDMLSICTNAGDDFEATEMSVYVHAPSISSIVLNGVTALYVEEPIRQNALTIDKSNTGFMYLMGAFQYLTIHSDGIGDMELEGKSENVLIDNEMTGNIYGYNFLADKMTLSHGGTGTVEINVNFDLDVDLHGVGDVYCKGYPEDVSKSGDGNGRLYMVD